MLSLDSIGKNFVVADCEAAHCHNPFGITNDYTMAVFGNVSGYPFDITGARNSPLLRDLMVAIVGSYTQRPPQYGSGPMTVGVGSTGASDQGSFAEAGFPANGLVESDIARNLGIDGFARQIHHTMYDTVDRVNFQYLRQMAVASLGYIIELSSGSNNVAVFNTTGVDTQCQVEFDQIFTKTLR